MQRIFRNLLSSRSTRKTSNRLNKSRITKPLSLSLLEDRSVPAVYTVNALTDSGTGAGLAGDLRYCITQANASAGVPDTINFDNVITAGQTIFISGTELLVTDTLTINGPTLLGPANPNCTIDGGSLIRLFNMTSASTATVETLTITALTLANGSVGGSGGAVFMNTPEDNYTFTDVVFSGNKGANYGGAIGGSEPAVPTTYGTVNITRCKFLNNENTLNFGGAIAFNTNISGGANVVKGYTANIIDTTFDGNKNDRNGGAMFIRGYLCTINVSNSTFSNNELRSDGFGGTISILSGAGAASSKLSFTNCTFSGNLNTDDVPGPPVGNGGYGGVFGNGGGATPTILIRNSTFTGNSAAGSGGVFAASSGTPSVTFESCILFGNFAGATANTEFEGGVISAKNSIIFNKAGAASFTDLGGNQFGAVADPLLGALGTSLGGLTAYHIPGSGSPARETGYADPAVTTDQRGAGFPRTLGSKVDVGSVETQDPAPIAFAVASNVTTPSVADYVFTVTYSDDVSIKVASIKTGNVTVSGPNAFSVTPTFVSVDVNTDGTPRTATYKFTPPVNGAAGWDFSDNGVYTVSSTAIVADQVNDGVLSVKAGALTTFSVGIPQTFTVTALTDANPGGGGVGAGTSGDLRYCIDQANKALGAIDNITFAVTGTITLTGGLELAVSEAVNINGPGSGKITVSGAGANRVFNLSGPGSYVVNVSGITVTGGNSTDGAAFLVADETLNLTNVVVTGNTASADGGGVVITSGGGKLLAVGTTFSNNFATLAGGAVALNANALAQFDGSSLLGNTATTSGGGVDLNLGNLIVQNSVIANNFSFGKGGGISLSQVLGTLSISNSTISNNTATTTGGGISTDHAGGTLNIRNSTFTSNVDNGGGGGLYHNGATAQPGEVVIVSSIFGGNFSTSADLEVTAVKFTVSNSLVTTKAGPAFVDGGANVFGVAPLLAPLGNYGGATQTNGLIAGSPAIDAGSNPDALAFDQRGSGFPRQVGSAVDMGAFEGVIPAPSATMTAIPDIVAAGATPNTVVLTWIDDTGINASTLGVDDVEIFDPLSNKLTITGFSVNTPGNGTPRVVTYTFSVPGGGWDVLDNGKYTVNTVGGKVFDTDSPTPLSNFGQTVGFFNVAVPNTYLVDVASDLDDGITTVGNLTLREAIGLANNDSTPSVINFSASVFSTAKSWVTAAGEMPISAAVTINGPTAKITLDGGAASRIFNINDTVAGSLISISNMTLTNGKAVGSSGGAVLAVDEKVTLTNVTVSSSTTDGNGGGVAFTAAGGSLTLVNCTISNNSATGTTSYGGGLEFRANTAVSIQNSTISGNTSGKDGGGIGFYNAGSLTLTNSSVLNNKADTVTGYLGGGGVYFFGTANLPGVVISGSTFSGNSSGTGLGGGGLMVQAGNGLFSIQNSTFSGNTANTGAGGGYGGAILVNGGLAGAGMTIRNSTIAGNDAGKSGGGFAFTGATATVSSTIISNNSVGGVGTGAGSDLFSLGTTVSGDNNLIGINDPTTKMTFSGTNPLIGTVGTPIDAKLAALAANGALPTAPQTRALLAGSPALNAGNNVAGLSFDQRGTGFNRVVGSSADIGAFEDQTAVAAAKVTSVVINSTKTGAEQTQRSRVFDVAVTFDSPVTFTTTAAAAFTLTKVGGGSVNLAASVSGNTVTLTFTGGSVDNVSLADGRYNLVALKAGFSGAGIDGTGPGDVTAGDDYNLTQQAAPNPLTPGGVFRFFGDFDGDGTVATSDFIQFRLALGGSSAIFDFDNDGAVATSDFIQFRLRFGGSI